MDSEKEKTGEIIRGTSQSSSLIRPLIQWYLPNKGIFLTENAASVARSFYAKHTQSSPKQLRTSLHDDQNHVTERRFSGSIPLDLAWEILSRVPAKSIVRSRSVSKLWSSVTTNPYFINSFPARSSKPCVLLVFQKGETLFVFSFPQHQYPIDPYSQVERYEVVNPNNRHFACSDSVRGLICFESSKQLVIWNPTMRRFLTLPEPENSSLRYVRGFLGYDPIECQHKVLSFLANEGIRVLTLGAQESWRMIEASPLHLPAPTKGYAQCINGILYYEAFCGLTLKHAIMSFDLRFETFNLIEFPMNVHIRGLLVTYEGRLALVNSMRTGVEIWIMEDEENQKWSLKHVMYPTSVKISRTLDLKGVTDDGELVYTPRSLSKSFHVVYFDLKRKSIRETKFKGMHVTYLGNLRDLDMVL